MIIVKASLCCTYIILERESSFTFFYSFFVFKLFSSCVSLSLFTLLKKTDSWWEQEPKDQTTPLNSFTPTVSHDSQEGIYIYCIYWSAFIKHFSSLSTQRALHNKSAFTHLHTHTDGIGSIVGSLAWPTETSVDCRGVAEMELTFLTTEWWLHHLRLAWQIWFICIEVYIWPCCSS